MRPVVLTVVDLVVVAEVRARLEPAPAVGNLRLHEPILQSYGLAPFMYIVPGFIITNYLTVLAVHRPHPVK